jgi:hypothetical protein
VQGLGLLSNGLGLKLISLELLSLTEEAFSHGLGVLSNGEPVLDAGVSSGSKSERRHGLDKTSASAPFTDCETVRRDKVIDSGLYPEPTPSYLLGPLLDPVAAPAALRSLLPTPELSLFRLNELSGLPRVRPTGLEP